MTGVEQLREASFPLPAGAGHAVPEPAVKTWLRERFEQRIPVPAGVTVDGEPADDTSWAGLQEPLVLKAFGAGLVHKSDAGAVRLGLSGREVLGATKEMADELARVSLRPGGYLIEEQARPGIELIVGVVAHPSVGAVALLGLGGTLAEVLNQSVVRLCPLSPADAEDMIRQLPGATLLDGVRGRPAADRAALIELLLAVAGEGDSVMRALGDELLEFECNPVVVGPERATALDARLILRSGDAPGAVDDVAPPTDFAQLFAPRSVAVAGASSAKVTFGNRFLQAYRAAGWSDNLYAVHPKAEAIDGVPAVASVRDIPGGVDYLLVGVPAARCAELIRDAAGAARFVHVVSGGFAETGADGSSLQSGLRTAARESGLRVLGPNCMGVYSPRGRQTFQLGGGEPGEVSVLSQSGGLTGDILQSGQRAGLRFAQLASIGNAVDVTAAELLDWLVDDPQTQIIGLYLEGLADGRRLAAALRRADGVKPVVLLIGGISDQGARAVASHTGSMTSDERIWQAIVQSSGAVHVHTLEDLIGVLLYAQRWAFAKAVPPAAAGQVLIVGPGGGASVLSADACDRAGLRLARIGDDVQQELRGLGYGAGTSVANPLEIPLGPATGPDSFARILEPLLTRESFTDILLHVNVASYYGYGPPDLAPLAELIAYTGGLDTHGARLALALRNAGIARGADADLVAEACRSARLPTFTTLEAAARGIAALQRFSARREGSGGRATRTSYPR